MSDQNNNSEILLPILKKIPLFSDLDDVFHKEIVNHIVLMYYPKNYRIFKQGDLGDALYIIKNGTVVIYHEPREEVLPEKIAEIGTSGFFGEMALISDVPRNASAKTTNESEIFILNKADFKKLLDTNKVPAEQISKTVIERLKEKK